MHVIHVTCSHCGHRGSITESELVKRMMAGARPALVCSACWARPPSYSITISYDQGVNPYQTGE